MFGTRNLSAGGLVENLPACSVHENITGPGAETQRKLARCGDKPGGLVLAHGKENPCFFRWPGLDALFDSHYQNPVRG